jgi:bifunctional DNase/RNase
MPSKDMLSVEVTQLFLSNVGFVVLLKGDEDERSLPIFIGAAEAQSIAIYINRVDMPRPLTHDLLKNTLDFLECRLMRIEICDLKEGTFFARLILDRDGVLMTMDCRPSDAIALALRCKSPIFAARHVVEEAGRVFEDEDVSDGTEDGSGKAPEGGWAKKPSHEKSPLESLKAELDQAVKDERYEDAARLRDEIQRWENTHTEN